MNKESRNRPKAFRSSCSTSETLAPSLMGRAMPFNDLEIADAFSWDISGPFWSILDR